MRRLPRPCLPLLSLALAACGPSLATRYDVGNQALSHGDGAMYFVVISPRLRDALNGCIPPGTPGVSPVLMVVADVDAEGNAPNLRVEPDSPGSDCVRQRLTEKPLPRPPLKPGAKTFPVGLRIDTK
jgi:hypothetical protein